MFSGIPEAKIFPEKPVSPGNGPTENDAGGSIIDFVLNRKNSLLVKPIPDG